MSLVIDIHAHFLPKRMLELYDANVAKFPSARLTRSEKGVQLQFPGGEITRPIMPKLMEFDERRKWMDANGIDHQLIGGWLDSFGYELPAKEGLAWSRLMNDCLWDAVTNETRFTPLATVPLQDGAMAAEVLTEVMERGFGGVMIGTLPNGQGGNLDDPSLDPFWKKAAELKAGVYLHPMFICGEPRLADYDLVNAIGRVADTSIAVARLLFSGHLLKFPGLKLVLSHGGAALPLVMGRLARNAQNSQGKYADPRKGFAELYFDTCIFDTDSLEYLAKKASADRIMLGSDWPFPIGDPAPLKIFDGSCFDQAQRGRMLGGTAEQVFRVRKDALRK